MTWTIDLVNYGSGIQWSYVKIYQDPNTDVILYTSTRRRTVFGDFQSRDADLTLTASQTGTIVTVVFTMANLNKTTDQNGYKASVANDYPDVKTIDTSTILTVLDKSRTATLSSDKTSVCQNGKVNLTCTSGPANPAPSSYEFYNNGVLVGTSASNVYEATATAGLPDVNKFVCVPRNFPGGSLENGSVEVTAKVTPTATQRFGNRKTLVEGSNLTLACNASGTTPLNVTWTRSGSPDVVGLEYPIMDIRRGDAGLYHCTVNNGAECPSNTATINVIVNYKPILTTLTTNQSKACLSDAMNLECTTDANPPVHEYRFYLNDELVYTSSSGVYQFNTPQAGNNTYKCEPVNTVGTGQNATVTVSTKAVVEGQSLTLFCNATGLPAPNITWTKVGGSTVGSGATFTIASVVRGDEGSYRCTASNGDECSNTTADALVTVNFFTCSSCEQRRDTSNENKTIIATLGGLFALSLVLNIVLIAYCLRIKGSNDELHKGSNSNSKSGHVNDIPLQETRFKNADLTPNSAPEHEPIGTRGSALSNPCFPEYEAVSTSTQPTNQPSAEMQANDLNSQRQTRSPQNVGQQPPTNMASIYQNIQLSPLTKLSTSNPSSLSSNQAGEYQALKQKGSSSQYQSLDELSRC